MYNKKLLLLTLFFFFILIIFFLQTVYADVISRNAGGDTEIALTPDNYIEGFFSGIPPIIAPTSTPTPTPSGGGGGGGAIPSNIQVAPTDFDITLAVNTTTGRTIRVTNLGTGSLTVSVGQTNLGNHIILENTTLTIPGGGFSDLNVVFVALSQPGIFAGTINIGGKQVLVSLNVKTNLLLFDSNIVVLNNNYQVPQGDQLQTKVTLIPLGDKQRLDVSLFFTIRDYAGKIYLTKSETILVQNLSDLNRNFDTGILPPGKYVIGLELSYLGQVAPSSAHFEVTQKKISLIGKIIIYLIGLILLLLIIIMLILIWRRVRERKEETSEEAAEEEGI